VDPDVASGKAAEFAPLDLVQARVYEEDGSRRALVQSGDDKPGRVEEVKVKSELIQHRFYRMCGSPPPVDYGLLSVGPHCGTQNAQGA
jgi:hypothetical protein